MHIHSLEDWCHEHTFVDDAPRPGERRAHWVIGLTVITMVVEVAAGMAFHSMALLADGWHMASHAAALGITAFAYWYARRHAFDARYTFGTGKVGSLGGFASAVVLGVVAVLMVTESVSRFMRPEAIAFDEAIAVAVLGLAVNLASVVLLNQGSAPGHRHDHPHGHAHDHQGHRHDHPHGQDHNLRAAFLHVAADALTSVLAIVALVAGRAWGWVWMDPVMGLVGAAVIGVWTVGLLRETGRVLLDGAVGAATRDALRAAVEGDADNRVTDLHVWRVGPRHLAAIVSVVTHAPRPPEHYKALLRASRAPGGDLAHVTVEVHGCTSAPCLPLSGPNGR